MGREGSRCCRWNSGRIGDKVLFATAARRLCLHLGMDRNKQYTVPSPQPDGPDIMVAVDLDIPLIPHNFSGQFKPQEWHGFKRQIAISAL